MDVELAPKRQCLHGAGVDCPTQGCLGGGLAASLLPTRDVLNSIILTRTDVSGLFTTAWQLAELGFPFNPDNALRGALVPVSSGGRCVIRRIFTTGSSATVQVEGRTAGCPGDTHSLSCLMDAELSGEQWNEVVAEVAGQMLRGQARPLTSKEVYYTSQRLAQLNMCMDALRRHQSRQQQQQQQPDCDALRDELYGALSSQVWSDAAWESWRQHMLPWSMEGAAQLATRGRATAPPTAEALPPQAAQAARAPLQPQQEQQQQQQEQQHTCQGYGRTQDKYGPPPGMDMDTDTDAVAAAQRQAALCGATAALLQYLASVGEPDLLPGFQEMLEGLSTEQLVFIAANGAEGVMAQLQRDGLLGPTQAQGQAEPQEKAQGQTQVQAQGQAQAQAQEQAQERVQPAPQPARSWEQAQQVRLRDPSHQPQQQAQIPQEPRGPQPAAGARFLGPLNQRNAAAQQEAGATMHVNTQVPAPPGNPCPMPHEPQAVQTAAPVAAAVDGPGTSAGPSGASPAAGIAASVSGPHAARAGWRPASRLPSHLQPQGLQQAPTDPLNVNPLECSAEAFGGFGGVPALQAMAVKQEAGAEQVIGAVATESATVLASGSAQAPVTAMASGPSGADPRAAGALTNTAAGTALGAPCSFPAHVTRSPLAAVPLRSAGGAGGPACGLTDARLAPAGAQLPAAQPATLPAEASTCAPALPPPGADTAGGAPGMSGSTPEDANVQRGAGWRRVATDGPEHLHGPAAVEPGVAAPPAVKREEDADDIAECGVGHPSAWAAGALDAEPALPAAAMPAYALHVEEGAPEVNAATAVAAGHVLCQQERPAGTAVVVTGPAGQVAGAEPEAEIAQETTAVEPVAAEAVETAATVPLCALRPAEQQEVGSEAELEVKPAATELANEPSMEPATAPAAEAAAKAAGAPATGLAALPAAEPTPGPQWSAALATEMAVEPAAEARANLPAMFAAEPVSEQAAERANASAAEAGRKNGTGLATGPALQSPAGPAARAETVHEATACTLPSVQPTWLSPSPPQPILGATPGALPETAAAGDAIAAPTAATAYGFNPATGDACRVQRKLCSRWGRGRSRASAAAPNAKQTLTSGDSACAADAATPAEPEAAVRSAPSTHAAPDEGQGTGATPSAVGDEQAPGGAVPLLGGTAWLGPSAAALPGVPGFRINRRTLQKVTLAPAAQPAARPPVEEATGVQPFSQYAAATPPFAALAAGVQDPQFGAGRNGGACTTRVPGHVDAAFPAATTTNGPLAQADKAPKPLPALGNLPPLKKPLMSTFNLRNALSSPSKPSKQAATHAAPPTHSSAPAPLEGLGLGTNAAAAQVMPSAPPPAGSAGLSMQGGDGCVHARVASLKRQRRAVFSDSDDSSSHEQQEQESEDQASEEAVCPPAAVHSQDVKPARQPADVTRPCPPVAEGLEARQKAATSRDGALRERGDAAFPPMGPGSGNSTQPDKAPCGIPKPFPALGNLPPLSKPLKSTFDPRNAFSSPPKPRNPVGTAAAPAPPSGAPLAGYESPPDTFARPAAPEPALHLGQDYGGRAHHAAAPWAAPLAGLPGLDMLGYRGYAGTWEGPVQEQGLAAPGDPGDSCGYEEQEWEQEEQEWEQEEQEWEQEEQEWEAAACPFPVLHTPGEAAAGRSRGRRGRGPRPRRSPQELKWARAVCAFLRKQPEGKATYGDVRRPPCSRGVPNSVVPRGHQQQLLRYLRGFGHLWNVAKVLRCGEELCVLRAVPLRDEQELSYMRGLYDYLMQRPEGLSLGELFRSEHRVPESLLKNRSVWSWLKTVSRHFAVANDAEGRTLLRARMRARP